MPLVGKDRKKAMVLFSTFESIYYVDKRNN